MSVEAAIAANRFGLGARPGELRAIATDPRSWLTAQIKGPRALTDCLRRLPSSEQIFATLSEVLEARRAKRKAATPSAGDVVAAFANLRGTFGPVYLDQVAARYDAAVGTHESFRERLVHFWSNHFAVSADKIQVAAFAATLENEVIRPGITGTFADLLLAVESHPAMILYLDNQASVGPNSTLALRADRRGSERKLDINENLAREILELHTLGVNGGYTQADVTTFALALTGWSIGGGRAPFAEGKPGTFQFRAAAHEPGARTILGRRYGEDGVAQPRAMLRDLARHPATAEHLATKLVRHFVSDAPPPGAVTRVASVFRDTDGDLPSVHRALVDLPQAWSASAAKYKSPHEFVVSTWRAIDTGIVPAQQIVDSLSSLGQRPFTPGSPAGWPDVASQWDGADALLKRIEWGATLSAADWRIDAARIADDALGAACSAHTRQAVARAATSAQAVTLLLASPEFQQR